MLFANNLATIKNKDDKLGFDNRCAHHAHSEQLWVK